MSAMRRGSDDDSISGGKDGKLCYNLIPTRVVFVFLGFIGFNLIYAYKVVISVAIVAMVKNHKTSHLSQCEAESGGGNSSLVSTTSAPKSDSGEFDWTDSQTNLVLGAFFYGYVCTQIPGGLLAERFGAKWMFGMCVLLTAILSLLSPVAARGHYVLFFIVRVCQGLSEGGVFPIMASMLAKWLPKMERSLGSTIIFTGAQIGTVITEPLAGYLCDQTFFNGPGWPSIFYLLGAVGVLWFVLWAIFIFERPDRHPHISSRELEFIKKGQGEEVVKQRPKLPWSKVLTSVPVYALIVTHFCQNWGYLTVLTLLPQYFQKILGMDIQSNGLMSSLPWLTCALTSWLVGMISDKVRSTGKVPINVIRKFCNTVAYMGPAICLVGVVFVKCDKTASVALFVLAMGLNGFIFSGLMCTHVDMAPDFAGTLMGMTNSIGNIPGFVAPQVATAFNGENGTLKSWSYVFYVSAAVYAFGALTYLFFASAQLQEWAKGRSDERSDQNVMITDENGIENSIQNDKHLNGYRNGFDTGINNKGFVSE